MSVAGSDGWLVKEFLLRRNCEARDFVEVRVAVVGNVDAGKSTMLGVLTHGELDNGRGLARLRIFRHKHEFESGRTSSVSNDILGFDADGVVVNKPVRGKLDWSEICQKATKVITFIDLAGHERYLKTTVVGLTGHAPDFVMLMVGANAGIIGMTKEHLGLALALSVPVFVVITKVDMCPPNVLNETINLLFRILKSPGCRKIPVLISSKDDVICSAINFTSERMCPVFLVSNVTGSNLDLLTSFLNLLSPRSPSRLEDPAEFQIDELFKVPGVGCVVSGTCLGGIIRVNDVLLLGPDSDGLFIPVPVKSIQRKRLTVNEVHGGQAASIALKRPRVIELRRGMILAARSLQAYGCMEFQATVLILHHPTTISVGYQAMVHAGPVRQTAKILVIIGKERLRTGDKAEVRFQFIRRPEYLRKGVRLVFREGKTKAVGTVTETVPYQLVFPARVSRASQPLPTDQSTASSQPRPAYAVAAADHQSESAAASPLPTAPTTTPRTPAHLSVTTAIATATATNT
uniref:Tr-type G domain-containing protein n=1 Tax=Schistocephalus solidus TaxID=70667 RepID=A0A0X3NIZ9_SCHSO